MSKRKQKLLMSLLVAIFAVIAAFWSNNSSSLSQNSKTNTATGSLNSSQNVEGASVSNNSSETGVDSNLQTQLEGENPTQTEGAQIYQVVKVVDGDTIELNIDGEATKIRVIGIDTPETVDPRKTVQCFGKEASNKAKELLNNQYVTIESDPTQDDKDKYGRLLRYVSLQDGTDYGMLMISNGYAHEYTYKIPYQKQSDYKQAESDARSGNRGLWSPETCSGNK